MRARILQRNTNTESLKQQTGRGYRVAETQSEQTEVESGSPNNDVSLENGLALSDTQDSALTRALQVAVNQEHPGQPLCHSKVKSDSGLPFICSQ